MRAGIHSETTTRWVVLGAILGLLVALVAFAPARWLTAAVNDATDQRLLLADARGTVWQGSAQMVLTAGPQSRTASALPGRFRWQLGIGRSGLALRAQQDCCIDGELLLRVVPGVGRVRFEVPPGASELLGRWPASWLIGLGTPWNTLQPSGTLALSTPGLSLERVQGRWRFDGSATLELQQMASRVSTLDTLGSWRVVVRGRGAEGDAATLQLSTLSGPLLLSGSGQWAGSKLRFNGEARAEPGSEVVLSNLLNIIGRRQGAASVISIG